MKILLLRIFVFGVVCWWWYRYLLLLNCWNWLVSVCWLGCSVKWFVKWWFGWVICWLCVVGFILICVCLLVGSVVSWFCWLVCVVRGSGSRLC